MTISVDSFPLNASQVASAGFVTAASAQAAVVLDAGPRDGAIVTGLPGWTTPPWESPNSPPWKT